MSWFYDLPLRKQLLAASLPVAAASLVVVFVAFRSINVIGAAGNEIGAAQVPALLGLIELNMGVSDIRRAELGMTLAKISKDEPVFARRVDEYKTQILKNSIEKGRALYEPHTRTPEEDVLWKKLGTDVADYASYMDRQISLLQAGLVDSARIRSERQGLAQFTLADVTLDSLTELQRKYSVANEAAIGSALSQSRYLLGGGIAIAGVIACWLAVFLSGYLVRSIGIVSTRVEQLRSMCITNLGKGIEALSRGELDVKVVCGTPHIKLEQKDELGVLARNVDGIISQSVSTIEAYERAAAILRETVGESQTLIQAARSGQLETRADASKYHGGFHTLVNGLNQTLEGVSVPLREAGAVLQRLAERDLGARMKGTYEGDYAAMKEAINVAATNLDETLAQVQAAAEQVAAAGGQITAGSQSLAQSASEQASSIEEVSSSLQEMAAMTKQNTDNTRIATTYVAETRASAADGVTRMNELSSAINKIKASADQTAKIVKTIDEIAFQTNLLALNAAVEAARAGDAGKGFAVVADEVRNLAMRSAEAAKTTAALIEESVVNANGGVTMNAEVLKTLGAINAQVVKVSDVVAEIAAASEQQSQGVDQINGAVLQMNAVTQQMASGAEESASAAEELASQSNVLTDMVGQFQLSDEGLGHGRPAARSSAGRAENRPATRVVTAKAKANGNGNGNRQHSQLDSEKLLPFDEDVLLTTF
jgi:methyl-accepting chemotaxis protein